MKKSNTIGQPEAKLLAPFNRVSQVSIWPVPDGYGVWIEQRRLCAFRGNPRVFKTIDSLMTWMRKTNVPSATIYSSIRTDDQI